MFDAGDVITLLAALAVVFLFRQLDRSNRSLEKVKRYGDRVMRTLSTFVEKKNSEIKDLSIEVQVSVKQGKELLRSVRDVQDGLAVRRRDLEERSSEIDAISARIDGYDAALAELVNMSERVDENLRRLRGEDERLRRVDDQRTALQERLTGLDAKAASIEERLDERLQAAAIEGRLADIEDTARQAAAARLADFERRFATDLRERTAELQRRSGAEIDSVRATVDRFESETAERCAALDAELTRIAEELEARLTGMETTRQAVQGLHAKFRQLDELAGAADERYRQLAEKREVAEATASGVDRNFELLNQLDEQVMGLRPDVLKLTAGMAEMQRQVDVLAGNKESADAVIRSLDGIEGLLAELDGRTARLTAAREWLARAETRLERIGQQAQASVSELEALAGARSADNGGGAGPSPTVDNRQAVSKLAGQGWSIREIARATKLSQSEVELILEGEPAAGVLPSAR